MTSTIHSVVNGATVDADEGGRVDESLSEAAGVGREPAVDDACTGGKLHLPRRRRARKRMTSIIAKLPARLVSDVNADHQRTIAVSTTRAAESIHEPAGDRQEKRV